MRRNASWWMLVFACLLFLGSCAMPLEPRFEGVNAFKPHLKSDSGPKGITLGLDIHNPNAYKIKILRYDLDIFVNGKKIGDAVHKGKQVLQPATVSALDVEIETDLKQVLGGVIGALSGLLGMENALEIKVQGILVARSKLITKRVPIDFEKRFEINKRAFEF